MSALTGFNPNQKFELGHHSAPLHSCPKCQSYTDARIENGKIIDKYFFWLSLKKYQCKDCQHQFYIVAR